MKIAYISSARIPDEWAHVFHIMHMCESFAHMGHKVKLVIPYRNKMSTIDPFIHASVKPNFTIVRLPCLDFFAGTTSVWWFYVRTISFFLSAKIYLMFASYDILYTREFLAPYFFKNFFFEAHTAKISNQVLKRARGVVTVTSFIKDVLKWRGYEGEHILVEPDAVDLHQFINDSPKEILRRELKLPNGLLIGYVGTLKTMDKEKGLKTMMDVLKLIPQVSLVIVGGEKHHVEEYRKIAEDAGLLPRIMLTGTVSHTLVSKYLHAFDVVVAPFPDIEHYRFYMSPLKIFEYMASGTPMVVSDLPSLREVLTEQTTCFVPPENVKAFGLAIQNLIEHPDQAHALGQRAKKAVIYHTWDKRAERITRFIQNISR